jgi:signal transduction histidine kinase
MEDATYTRGMQSDARNRNDSTGATGPRSLWDSGPLSPLNIAAYITWLPVSFSMLDARRLAAPEVEEWLGAACLLGFISLFVARIVLGRERARHERWSMAVVLPQGALALLAIWLLDRGSGAVLLILVAVQLFGILGWRVAVLWQAAFNLGLVLIWRVSFGLEWERLLIELLPVVGFQAFAALTAHYATAVERTRDELSRVNAELLATQTLLQESTRGEERLKLSRELHDVAGHKLTALKLNLARLARDPALAAREEIAVSTGLAHELLDDIRAVVGELRKHDGVDLRAAIESLARQVPGPRFRIEVADDARVHSVQAAETLLRCAQEGITNALRHGHPDEITVWCGRRDGTLELRVRDDGATAPKLAFGNGLTGMRERLAALGGTLQVLPASRRGVELIASLPASA